MDRPQWTPPVCDKCGRQNPGHGEMECPSYEYCSWCRSSGAYGFLAKHRCTGWNDEAVVEDEDMDDRDHGLWNNDDAYVNDDQF